MNQQVMADLILGTYEHDLFKPFWLGNDKHARLGYAFLQEYIPARPLRRIAVLLHTDFQSNLALLKGQEGSSWPKVLMAAPWVDRIASASYSLLDEEKGAESLEPSATREVTPLASADKEKKPTQPIYKQIEESWPPSVQNPFSRLPIWSGALGVGRLLAPKTPKGDGYQKGGDYVATNLRPRFLSAGDGSPNAPHSGQKYAETAANIANATPQQWQLLAQTYPIFAERTYPHANDTGLAAHTRLAANLYHILLQNLDTQHEFVVETLDDIVEDQLTDWLNPKKMPALLLPLFASYVVTVRLAGIEERFLNAVRLDDLQGAKLLAERVRHALKRRICADLFGFSETRDAQSCDGHALPHLLCLSEERFSLTCLIPAACGDAAALLERLYTLYRHSLADVVDLPGPPWEGAKDAGQPTTPLLAYLATDIRRTLDDAGVNDTEIRLALMPDRATLLEGLQVMLPAIGLAPVALPTSEALTPEDIGHALVRAYRAARAGAQDGQTPPSAAADLVQANVAQEAEDLVICAASNASPAWTTLADYAYGRNGKQPIDLLQQYFHAFRAEQEELSQASVALRAWAQGVASAPLLTQLIQAAAEPPPTSASVTLTFAPAQVGAQHLPPPPFLERIGQIKRADGLVDLNAAYVRLRRDGAVNGDPLIRFPSVSYAADATGNVVMLTLRPGPALDADQCFPPGFMEQMVAGDERWQALAAYADLRTYYFNANPAISADLRRQLLTIPAHLARVLQRQQTVNTFLTRLPLRWEAAGVRVLTLEDRFPVGRYLLPADQLTTVLDVLDLALCLDLLAVCGEDLGLRDEPAMTAIGTYNVRSGNDAQKRSQLRALLAAYAPQVIIGTTLLFKHKQALYLMLRAEDRLYHQVEPQSVLAMGLADMRGTLIDRGELHGAFHFAQWGDILDAAGQLDRRSLDGLARDRLTVARLAKLASAAPSVSQPAGLAEWVEARWINRLSGADVKQRVRRSLWAMGKADEQAQNQAQAAHFLARATRG